MLPMKSTSDLRLQTRMALSVSRQAAKNAPGGCTSKTVPIIANSRLACASRQKFIIARARSM